MYTVDEAFNPFLQCYHLQNKLVDALVLISADSYARGQNEMGEMYLTRALASDTGHEVAAKLKRLVYGEGGVVGSDVIIDLGNDFMKSQLRTMRDSVDISKQKDEKKFWDQFKETSGDASDHMTDKTPEDVYNIATTYFNNKNLTYASELFELSCQKSKSELFPACANAIYLRTNLCDWGKQGEQYEKDMEDIKQITEKESDMYRLIVTPNDKLRKQNGLHDKIDYEGGIIHWKRSTSVHPHMMLGYLLDNSNLVLKRHVAESMASLDEIRARLNNDGTIRELPQHLPYSVEEMRVKFAEQSYVSHKPIKVGFVGCGFNSKAVMYLSQDMFRFFDPSLVEVHIFSTGQPDHPLFIQGTMRGVDWRQNVIDNVDYFHDVNHLQGNHIELAKFIHEKEIMVLLVSQAV